MKITFKKKLLLVAITSLLFIPLLADTARGGDSIPESVLTAKDPSLTAEFGLSIAVSGNRIVVGAPFNGSAAYVFTRDGDTWDAGYQLPLPPSGADYFGWDVAISGDTVIVAAFDSMTPEGSAHVYRYVEGNWNYEAELISGLGVGASVAIDGDIALVGAIIQNSGGSAYVFVYDKENSTWQPEAELTALTSFPLFFGWDVAISGNTAVVGAPSFSNPQEGTAHVFNRSVTGEEKTWTEIDTPLSTNSPVPEAYFGAAVAIDGTTVVVGEPPNLNLYTGTYDRLGSAHVFRLNPDDGSWERESLPIPVANGFGNSVDISENTIVVGAPLDNFNKVPEVSRVGATYVFARVGEAWIPSDTPLLLASDGGDSDQFGWSVAIDSDTVAVGAPFWDYSDDVKDASGAAYVYTLPSASQPPIAEAIADPEKAKEGQKVFLEGSGDDPDGDPLKLEYLWEQIETGGPPVELFDPTEPTAYFFAPELTNGCETLTFQLTVTDDQGEPSKPAEVQVKVRPYNTVHAKLGGEHRHWWYWHKYTFDGSSGDEITIRLEADPDGWHRGEKATLILKDKTRGVRLLETKKGSLPLELSTPLEADGKYAVYVFKQPWFWFWRDNSFEGDYILTLDGTCGRFGTSCR